MQTFRLCADCRPVSSFCERLPKNTSLREGGGLGRSPKTEGAIGHNANLIDRGGTSPGLSNPINHFLGKLS